VASVNKFQRSKLKKIRFANSVMKSFCSVQSVDLINVVSVRGHKLNMSTTIVQIVLNSWILKIQVKIWLC
jgi:hypothetical protein